MANIKDDPAYDPFPKSGLVRQYKPYILKTVRQFCQAYPRLDLRDVLFKAVELAVKAEGTFKPELGFSFATHLGGFKRPGRLKELHRLHDQQEAAEGIKIYRTKEDLAHEEAEENGEPTAPVNFAGGGNGVRLLFDLQWWEARISDIVSYTASLPRASSTAISSWAGAAAKSSRTDKFPMSVDYGALEPIPTTKKRHRLKLGTQLRQIDNAPATHERISADLPQVVKQQPPEPFLVGWIWAVVTNAVWRQREADDEARKRLAGDHSPTFFERIRIAVDVKFYKGRKPPRHLPQYMPMARLDDAYSHSEDGKRSLHDTIAAPDRSSDVERELQAHLEAVRAVRPTLTNKNEIAALDRLEARLKGTATGGLSQLAKEIGIPKGTASKVAARLAEKFRVTKRRA